MTAEVAVLNSIGVAVAADSAVTLTGPGATSKIYTSAEKIYQLASVAPVGIMTYGNATLIGIPWETTIKVFREQLGDKSLDTLDEYAKQFFGFLTSAASLFPPERQEEFFPSLVREHLLMLREELKDCFDDHIAATGRITDQIVEATTYQCLTEIRKRIKANELVDSLSGYTVSDICREFRPIIDELTNNVFDRLATSVRVRLTIRVLIAESILRKIGAGSKSGVVFVGFGDSEYLPKLQEYTVDEFAAGHLRWFAAREQEITASNSGAVVPFAQTKDVEAFMEGSDRGIRRRVIGYQRDALNAIAEVVGDQLTSFNMAVASAVEALIHSLAEDMVETTEENWNSLARHHWRPIIDTVSALPKDEMADMAENLVNLSRFRKRISTEAETVAGPIDVAVITKGDGFVWIRRKHYFDPELNPRVIGRLRR